MVILLHLRPFLGLNNPEPWLHGPPKTNATNDVISFDLFQYMWVTQQPIHYHPPLLIWRVAVIKLWEWHKRADLCMPVTLSIAVVSKSWGSGCLFQRIALDTGHPDPTSPLALLPTTSCINSCTSLMHGQCQCSCQHWCSSQSFNEQKALWDKQSKCETSVHPCLRKWNSWWYFLNMKKISMFSNHSTMIARPYWINTIASLGGSHGWCGPVLLVLHSKYK